MEIVLEAVSSKGGGYQVTFAYVDDKLSVFCQCPAGKTRKFCKHKWQLLQGNVEMLANPDQADALEKVHAWAGERSFEHLYDHVNQIELEIEVLKKTLSAEKKKVERLMFEGF